MIVYSSNTIYINLKFDIGLRSIRIRKDTLMIFQKSDNKGGLTLSY